MDALSSVESTIRTHVHIHTHTHIYISIHVYKRVYVSGRIYIITPSVLLLPEERVTAALNRESLLDRLDDVIASKRDDEVSSSTVGEGFIEITGRMESRECKNSIPKRLGTLASYKPSLVHVVRVLIAVVFDLAEEISRIQTYNRV